MLTEATPSLTPEIAPVPPRRVTSEDLQVEEKVTASVKRWTTRIKDAKKLYKKDFERMRMNMEFAAGYQWEGQQELQDNRYIANIVLQALNRKVAQLYARNPKAVANPVPRMDFMIWDGKMETLQATVMKVQQQIAMMLEPEMEDMALIADYQQGKHHQDLVKKVAETLEKVYQWNITNQDPEFKGRMKSLVRRVATCGVGYTKLSFVRDPQAMVEEPTNLVERTKAAETIRDLMAEGDVQPEQAEAESFDSLVASLGVDTGESDEINERLVFNYPSATSIIPDPTCTNLKGFVGANWIVEEHLLSLEFVNEFYEVKITRGSGVTMYKSEGEQYVPDATAGNDEPDKTRVCVWEVYDKRTRSYFAICDGYKDYLCRPEPLYPAIKSFYPIFALTFNDIEVEQGLKTTIFPPSDVDLMRSAQKERNRTRQALREHRKANVPRHLTAKGWLTEKDKGKLEAAEPHAIIELQSVQPNEKIEDKFFPVPNTPIDPNLYDATPLEQDVQLAAGAQQADLGPAQPDVTATVGRIAEESRITVTSSNVDDLDDHLSDLARAGGVMLLKGLSADNAKEIAGPGAVWPEESRKDFLNEVLLEIEAASSGRPNQALEVSKWTQIGPQLQLAGANPQFLIREGIKRLDDRIDPSDAFPLVPPASPSGQAPPQGGSSPAPTQPSGNPVNAVPA